MKNITLNTGAAYYREWGRGEDPTVLVLHGWGVDSAQYEELGPMLAKHGFHVLVPDLPGFGNTPTPKKVWGVGEYVEWVREFAQRIIAPPLNLPLQEGEKVSISPPARGGARGGGSIILLGHSFGGRLAIKYAVKYPDQLRALILCSAAGIKPPLTLKRVALYCAAKIGHAIFSPPGLSWTGEILKRILYRFAGVTDYLKARGIMKEVLAKTVKDDLKPLLPKIKTLTLILWGEEDRTTPLQDAHTMARLIPGAKLITFPGARHNLPKNIPEKLAAVIVQYYHTS